MNNAIIVALDIINEHTSTIKNKAKIDIDLNTLFSDLKL